jgi:hypothetical protein
VAPADFSTEFLHFIRSSVPTTTAAELLLFLAAHPDRPWSAQELLVEMKTGATDVQTVAYHLSLFRVHGLVQEAEAQGVRYHPASPELAAFVVLLAEAYKERPVTLIRTIYEEARLKIKSFADAFKLRKDPE